MTLITVASGISNASTAITTAIGATTGVGISALGAAAGAGAYSTSMGAITGSTLTGALLGAAWTGTLSGTVISSCVAISSSGAYAVFGPIGGLIVGTNPTEIVTNDCWKPVLHDESEAPSTGRILSEILNDPRISSTLITIGDNGLPDITLHNVWNERYGLEYVVVTDLPGASELSFHAKRIL